jgi:hypothetical protein
MRIASSLMVLCLTLFAMSARASVIYDNGPVNGNDNAWIINSGYTVSDSMALTQGSRLTGFNFDVWVFHDTPLTVDWSITALENGGTVYGSGTASLTTTFLFTNQDGYDVDQETVSGLNLQLSAGFYWINLQNATTSQDSPVFWDQNGGIGCQSPGCPSQAYLSYYGSIPSESFQIIGSSGTGAIPEPGSILLLGSVTFGLLGIFRRRLP